MQLMKWIVGKNKPIEVGIRKVDADVTTHVTTQPNLPTRHIDKKVPWTILQVCFTR